MSQIRPSPNLTKDQWEELVLWKYNQPKWQAVLPHSLNEIERKARTVEPPELDLQTTETIKKIAGSFWKKDIRAKYHEIQNIYPDNGDTILLVVPTDKQEKAAVIEEPLLEMCSKSGLKLIESGVGEQPYGILVGLKGACNRGKNLLFNNESMSRINERTKQLEDNNQKVKKVIIGSIENFIVPGKTDKKGEQIEDDIDYGACIYVDLTSKEIQYSFSRGTPLPRNFVKFARSFGFGDNDKQETYGLITVGDCMHITLGANSGDWHKQVLENEESRYAILKECNTKLLNLLSFLKRFRSRSQSPGQSTRSLSQQSGVSTVPQENPKIPRSSDSSSTRHRHGPSSTHRRKESSTEKDENKSTRSRHKSPPEETVGKPEAEKKKKNKRRKPSQGA
ncbi:hypothetical protein ACMFMF_006836 [Clarireedia jacksonii]